MSNTMTIAKEAGSERHTRRVVVRPPFPGDLAIATVGELDRPADEKPLARLHLRDQRLFY
jgi:hypothetical protein